MVHHSCNRFPGQLHIVDSDEEVEEYNLNRQVLYNEHIGHAKVTLVKAIERNQSNSA